MIAPPPEHGVWRRGALEIATDPARLDVARIHADLLAGGRYPGVPRDTVERMIAGSLNFGVYAGARMVGYGRVVTDLATFGYIGDVFLDPERRGAGTGSWLLATMLGHPRLAEVRRWMLMCGQRPASLYRRFGFSDTNAPGLMMHRTDKEIYLRRARTLASGSDTA